MKTSTTTKLILMMSVFLLTASCSTSDPSVQQNPQFIPAGKLIIKDCGNRNCGLSFSKKSDDGKYDLYDIRNHKKPRYSGVSYLNPETQTFQVRLYTTSFPTSGTVDGIVYLGSNDYLKGSDIQKDYAVQNITGEYAGEYWGLLLTQIFFDAIKFIMLPLITLGGIAYLFYFLSTKEGGKFLKKLDKKIKKYEAK